MRRLSGPSTVGTTIGNGPVLGGFVYDELLEMRPVKASVGVRSSITENGVRLIKSAAWFQAIGFPFVQLLDHIGFDQLLGIMQRSDQWTIGSTQHEHFLICCVKGCTERTKEIMHLLLEHRHKPMEGLNPS